MDLKKRVFTSLLIIIFLTLIFYFITETITKKTGYFILETEKTNDFKNCLLDKNITLYINSYSPEETINKIKIYEYIDSVKIFNCYRNKDFCLSKGINTFPAWIINNKKIERDITFSELEELTGCKKIKA